MREADQRHRGQHRAPRRRLEHVHDARGKSRASDRQWAAQERQHRIRYPEQRRETRAPARAGPRPKPRRTERPKGRVAERGRQERRRLQHPCSPRTEIVQRRQRQADPSQEHQPAVARSGQSLREPQAEADGEGNQRQYCGFVRSRCRAR